MPNSLASIVHHHSNYRQFQNLVQDRLNGLSVISIVKALLREQKIRHNFHDAVIDISAPRMTSKYHAIYYYYYY